MVDLEKLQRDLTEHRDELSRRLEAMRAIDKKLQNEIEDNIEVQDALYGALLCVQSAIKGGLG